MGTRSKNSALAIARQALGEFPYNGDSNFRKPLSQHDIIEALEKIEAFKGFIENNLHPHADDAKIPGPEGKKSFLVMKHNKYVVVPTETIALFFVKYSSSIILCLDRQEYSVNDSLDHIQSLLPDKQFFRLNRQCLMNFKAIKEVEPYFARKLLVKATIPVSGNLVVSKEKASSFLHWLGDR